MKYITDTITPIKCVIILVVFLLPIFAFAQGYKPLVGIPGLADVNTDFNTYINTIYALSISIAALLAVIKIVIGGVKWMTTDIVTSKEDAKNDIRSALTGLLIVLGAVLILTVINKDIINVDLSMKTVSPPAFVENNDTPQLTINPVQDLNPSFTYLPVQVSSVEMEAFKNLCSQTGTLKIYDGQVRCYNVKNASIQVGVLCTTGDNTEVCSARKIQQRDYCINIVGGSFYPDNRYNSDTGRLHFSCIKQN